VKVVTSVWRVWFFSSREMRLNVLSHCRNSYFVRSRGTNSGSTGLGGTTGALFPYVRSIFLSVYIRIKIKLAHNSHFPDPSNLKHSHSSYHQFPIFVKLRIYFFSAIKNPSLKLFIENCSHFIHHCQAIFYLITKSIKSSKDDRKMSL
jgi:hypothetical protein